MVHFLTSATRRQCLAIPFALVAGLAMPMVLLSASRAIANDYEACANTLIGAGLDGSAAASACGKALNPTDLSSCTLDISRVAEVDIEPALLACQSDRRPKELATCVGDIHQNLEVANSAAVVNSCRLSVLPLRYSDCVVGVATAADLAVADSLRRCSAAGYIPSDVAPTFIFTR
ncbi:MAG: hypothetical protein WBG32_17850 [Nodosilinea sp.]